VTYVLILRKKFKPGGIDEKLSWIEADGFPNEIDYRIPSTGSISNGLI